MLRGMVVGDSRWRDWKGIGLLFQQPPKKRNWTMAL